MEYHRGFLLYHDLSFSTPFHAHSAHNVYAEYRLFIQLIAPYQNKTKPPHKKTLCTAAGVESKSKNAHPKSVSDLRTTSVARKSAGISKFVKSVCPKGKLKAQLKSVINIKLTSVAP